MAVVALETGRAKAPIRLGDGGKGRHFAGRAANVQIADVFRVVAEFGTGLKHDLLDPPSIEEVVDVAASERGGKRVIDLRMVEAEGAGLRLIDLDPKLGDIFHAAGANLAEGLVVAGQLEQLVAGSNEPVVTDPAGIDELQIETGRIAQFENRWRDEGDRTAAAQVSQRPIGALGDGGRTVFSARPFAPVMQFQEGGANILGLTDPVIAG